MSTIPIDIWPIHHLHGMLINCFGVVRYVHDTNRSSMAKNMHIGRCRPRGNGVAGHGQVANRTILPSPTNEPLTENDISFRCRFDVDCRLPPTGIDVRQNPGATSSSSHSMPAESENPIYPGGHRHVGLQSSVQLSGLLMSRHIDRTSWTADFTLSQ
jgi:hypothetical protein